MKKPETEAKKDEKKTASAETKKEPTNTGTIPKATAIVPGKRRRRTRSLGASLSPSPGRGFYVPGFNNGTSPSAMSLTELMDASKGTRGLTNMALAHEIAVDKNFQLTKNKSNICG